MSIANLFKTLDLTKGANQSLVVANGDIEWSSKVSSLQRDLFLLNNKINVLSSTYPEASNLNLDVYRDGAFTNITPVLCKVEISLSYRYIDSIGNLPFELMIKNNNIEVYKKSYGQLDSYTQLNKITDSFVVALSDSSNLTYFMRKLYNDAGFIEIQPAISYISVEIL